MVKLAAITLLAGLILASGTPARSADHGQVVLGSSKVVHNAVGWGTAHPRRIDNGGVPSGKAFSLRWTSWGTSVAHARGFTWIYTPHGGYYGKPGAIEMRAFRIGQCIAGGPRAYTRLQIRVARKPGGRLSGWFSWGGWHGICYGP
jgi:hypothetical protein